MSSERLQVARAARVLFVLLLAGMARSEAVSECPSEILFVLPPIHSDERFVEMFRPVAVMVRPTKVAAIISSPNSRARPKLTAKGTQGYGRQPNTPQKYQ